MKHKNNWRRYLLLGLVTLLFATPLSVASASSQSLEGMQQGGMVGGMAGGMRFGNMPINTDGLTEEQQDAYQSAKEAYEQAEDATFQDLITAGILTEADVLAYQEMRTQELPQTPQGQQPQGQAQQGQPPQGGVAQGFTGNPGMRGGAGGVWGTLMEHASDAAVQTAKQTLEQAQQTYQQALQQAGIETPTMQANSQPLGRP